MTIIPTCLDSGTFGGIAPAIADQVFGEIHPRPENAGDISSDSLDKIRLAALQALTEVHAVYRRDMLVHQPYSYGLMAGVDYLKNVLSVYPLLEGISLAHRVLTERLAEVDHIEAAFLSHGTYSSETRLLDQDENPVTDGEAYVWGCREGLVYAIKLCQTISGIPKPIGSSYLSLDSILQCFGAFASDQKHFVQKELPRLQKRYAERPSFYAVDILVHGWSNADDFIETHRLPRFDSREGEQDLQSKLSLVERDAITNFVEALRSQPMAFHTFKLGFGRAALRPLSKNRVFVKDFPAKDVPIDDMVEILRLHNQAGKTSSPKTWLLQATST